MKSVETLQGKWMCSARPLRRLSDTPVWVAIPSLVRANKNLTGSELSIQLTQGCWSLIDQEDEHLSSLRWFAAFYGREKQILYARRQVRLEQGKQNTVFLHRVILGDADCDGRQVDHIDKHILAKFRVVDNRRSNLRWVLPLKNQANKHKQLGCVASHYKGVYWDKRKLKWRARIQFNRSAVNLGSYELEQDAAISYNAAHSVFYPNIPEGQNDI